MLSKESAYTAAEVLLTAALAAVCFLSVSYKIANPGRIPEVLSRLPAFSWLGGLGFVTVFGVLLGLEAFVAVALVTRFHVTVALGLAIALCVSFSLLVAPFYERLGGDCGCLWRWVPFAPDSGLGLIVRNTCLACGGSWLFGRASARKREQERSLA
jgi:hypothetical protein